MEEAEGVYTTRDSRATASFIQCHSSIPMTLLYKQPPTKFPTRVASRVTQLEAICLFRAQGLASDLIC